MLLKKHLRIKNSYICCVDARCIDLITVKMNINKKEVQDDLEQNLQAIGPKRVLNLAECCALTGYSRGHTYRLTSTRQIPHSKRGKTLFF